MTSMRHEPVVTSADEPLLLDSYLGEYDVAEVHLCIVNGDLKTTPVQHPDSATDPSTGHVSRRNAHDDVTRL
jgi:hypothetical protein